MEYDPMTHQDKLHALHQDKLHALVKYKENLECLTQFACSEDLNLIEALTENLLGHVKKEVFAAYEATSQAFYDATLKDYKS